MKVRLALSGLFLHAVLLSHVQAGIIGISAYGNVSSQLRNSSVENPGTSRAMSGDGGYRNIFEGLPVKYETSSSQNSYKIPKYIVYPSNSQAVYPQQTLKEALASDRFAPGEAYGGTVYKIQKAKQEKRKGYQYQKPIAASFDDTKANPPAAPPAPPPSAPAPVTPPQLPPIIAGPTPLPATAPAKLSDPTPPAAPVPDASPTIQYIPPSDPNLFAPNIHSHYPPPPANGETRFNGITSYLPPAAGPVTDDSSAESNPPDSPPSNQYIPPAELFQFPPNIHSHYHPPPMGDNFHTNGLTSYLPPPAGPADTYLPPSGMSADSSVPGPPSSPDSSDDMIGTIPIGPDSPYPGYLPPSGPQSPAPPAPKPQMMMNMPPIQNMMMSMPPPKNMMMNMPSGPPMSGPPMDIPFDFHGYDNYYPHDHFPEYIFDHDHDHYHHDHHHDEPPPTTTPAPPPPPPEPKVYNYSYYKISRTLWFIPLYFTIYFVGYILILIIRSVARHKVNYPNNWTGRNLGVTRSLDDMQFITNEQAMNKADMMTQFVMQQIDDFREKYKG